MEQLLLKMDEKSEVKVIAASAFNFRIELVKKVGKDDIPGLIDISQCMADRFGSQALLTKTNIPKYFNSETLPFLARLKGEIIGYIIGVPLEYFKQDGKGGYGKTLKRIYVNWAKKQKYNFITGHVEQGISKSFPGNTEIVKVFPYWYGLKTPFEYYRRTLG